MIALLIVILLSSASSAAARSLDQDARICIRSCAACSRSFRSAPAGVTFIMLGTYCTAPSLDWNGAKLAPVVAKIKGNPKATPSIRSRDTGVMTAWIYGPDPRPAVHAGGHRAAPHPEISSPCSSTSHASGCR